MAGSTLYASTKSFNHTFSHILRKEVGDKIDVMTVSPGPTLTQMVKDQLLFVVTAESLVRWSLYSLGYEDETFGPPMSIFYRYANDNYWF